MSSTRCLIFPDIGQNIGILNMKVEEKNKTKKYLKEKVTNMKEIYLNVIPIVPKAYHLYNQYQEPNFVPEKKAIQVPGVLLLKLWLTNLIDRLTQLSFHLFQKLSK